MTVGEAAHDIAKLTGCGFGSEPWVEMLVREDADLSGWRIERPASDAAPKATFHQFAAGSIYRAGDVLRLYAGQAPQAPAEAAFAPVSTAGDPAVLASGVELALLDARGTAVHRRTFVSDAAAIACEVRVAADPDGTRAFIFLRNNAHHYLRGVPVGAYRFALTFRRTSAGAGQRILGRNASTAEEVATLTASVS